jgi:hypothetical protein
MFKKILNNQHGMSLMEVMIAASISIVVAMGVMKINETSQKGLRSTKLTAEVQNFQKNIHGHLLSRQKCAGATWTTGYNWLTGGATPGVAAEQHPDLGLAPVNYTEFNSPGDQFTIPVSFDNLGATIADKTFTIPQVLTPTIPRMHWANSWVLKSYRFYNRTDGLCFIKIEMEKVEVAAQGAVVDRKSRSFGAEVKDVWVKLDCKMNAAAPVNEIDTCVSNDTFAEGMWQENAAVGSNGMISGNLPAVLGLDNAGATQATAILDIFPTAADDTGGRGLVGILQHDWVETITLDARMGTNFAPIINNDVAVGVRLPYRVGIVFGNNNNSVGFFGDNDATHGKAIYTNDDASLVIGDKLTVLGGVTSLQATNITGNTTITGNTSIVGTTALDGDLTVSSTASITSHLDVDGTSYLRSVFATNYNTYSDKKLKREIKKIQNATQKLEKIRGVTYFMRHEDFPKLSLSKDKQFGFIAQEIKEIFPEMVSFNEKLELHTVNYSSFTSVLVEAFKEQLAEIKKNRVMFELMRDGVRIKNAEQDKRLEKLETKAKKLEKENKALRNDLNAVKRRLDEMMKLIEKKK